MTTLNMASAELCNRYHPNYKDADLELKNKRFWKNGALYGAGLGALLSVITLCMLKERSIAPGRREFAAKYIMPYVFPLLPALGFLQCNLGEINSYSRSTGRNYLPYIMALGMGYFGSVAGFWITHMIVGK